jgi:hypothetical protein
MALWNLNTILRFISLFLLSFGDVVLPSLTPDETSRTVLIDDRGGATMEGRDDVVNSSWRTLIPPT